MTCASAMTDLQQAMVAEARRVSAGDWIVEDVLTQAAAQFQCRRCETRVEFPHCRGTVDEFAGFTLYCLCDQARYDERAWREHFGVLAEIFG